MDASKDTLRKYCAECFGTAMFILMATMGVSGSQGSITAIATCFGVALTTAIRLAGVVSGGHLNPAVTLAMRMTGNVNNQDCVFYIAAQLLGGIIGATVARFGCVGEANFKGDICVGDPAEEMFRGLCAEVLGTLILVTVVFNTAIQSTMGVQTAEQMATRSNAAFTIGLAVWALHFGLVPITGCGINPARFFGTAVATAHFCPGTWIYFVGPAIGSALAVALQVVLFGRVTAVAIEPVHEAKQSQVVRMQTAYTPSPRASSKGLDNC